MNIESFQSELMKITGVSDSIRLDDLSDMMAGFFSSQEGTLGKASVPAEEGYDMNREMQLIDARYRAENALLDAIADGDEACAFHAIMDYGALMQSPTQKAFPTSADSIRDFKNSVHTMNTLFRKAIERNHVHPIYIHESSSDFGVRIEQAQTMETLALLVVEMIRRYCYLSQKYSVAVYSEPIRRAMLYIDLNLANPISTKEIAADQFLSPNYLSTRFHEETGKTVSDFILEKRIKMACKQLCRENRSIQEVATSVGIGDASYFSKQFKKIMGISPLQYQKNFAKIP